ncbi:MAG TPA: MASE1 domain-containing protein, partial [Verrucomicrobiae bacterium]|nr:MASE1 domain-containing protein [Verrucomicrobiae bacterium]
MPGKVSRKNGAVQAQAKGMFDAFFNATCAGVVYKRYMTLRRVTQFSEKPSFPLWQRAALFSLAYFLCASAGSYLSVSSTYVSFWLPAGLFVGVLLLNRTSEWPVLCLAALPANLAFDYYHDPKRNLMVMLLFYLANLVSSVAGAWLVRRLVAERPRLCTVGEFFGLVGFGGVLSPMLGAAIGAGTLVEFGASQSFVASWIVWWGSCTMAVLVFSPLLLILCGSREKLPTRFLMIGRTVEALLLYSGLAGFTWYLLAHGGGINSPKAPLLVFVLWAGLRFDLRGGVLAVFLLAVWSAFLTTHY